MGNGLGGLLLLLLLAASGIFVITYGMRLRARRSERLADLYQQALDKGLDLREVQFGLDEAAAGDPNGNLKAGVILLASALGMTGGIWAAAALAGPLRLVGFALVPAMIGLAALYIHYVVQRSNS